MKEYLKNVLLALEELKVTKYPMSMGYGDELADLIDETRNRILIMKEEIIATFKAMDEFACMSLPPDEFDKWCDVVTFWNKWTPQLQGIAKEYHTAKRPGGCIEGEDYSRTYSFWEVMGLMQVNHKPTPHGYEKIRDAIHELIDGRAAGLVEKPQITGI